MCFCTRDHSVHWTCRKTAAKVAMEIFDFRLSKPGYYGHGMYFSSQACKSHQYAKATSSSLKANSSSTIMMLVLD